MIQDNMKNAYAFSIHGSFLAYKIGEKEMSSSPTISTMYYLPLIAICETLTKGIRKIVCKLRSLFDNLCEKVIKIDNISDLE
jgi:hypothetical protein